MELIEVSKRISEKIALLESGRGELRKRAERKAKSIANYEKALALTIVKLKNGAVDSAFGHDCSGLPATLIEKTARGMVYSEKLEMELSDAEYRGAIAGMRAIEAELNGYQSINRHLQHEVR